MPDFDDVQLDDADFDNFKNVSADSALKELKLYNEKYVSGEVLCGDMTEETRIAAAQDAQQPYAVIVTCSDSRVVPEFMFTAGINELFVIRSAGNVIDNTALGSIEYAVEHLLCKLVVVLGHTRCGAIHTAIHSSPAGYIHFITDEIRKAIGTETNALAACKLNIQSGVNKVRAMVKDIADNIKVVGALYHIDTGVVDFLEE